MTLIFSSIVALLATAIFVYLLRPVARRVGLVDIPNERSSHRDPTPLVGGLAIYLGVAATYLLLYSMGRLPLDREIVSFFLASGLLVAVGVVDDYMRLSPLLRFVTQIIASLIMIYGAGVVINDIGAVSISGDIVYLGWLSVPFTVFATLGVINALNMCDGLDGLSGSLALISLTGLFIGAISGGINVDAILLVFLSASVLGFLLFNLRIFRRKNATIFMGDAGSMFLGFSLTWFAITLSEGPGRSITPATALWFLMLPIFDTVAMIFRRMVRRRSPFSPDREHLHHVLQMAGFTVNETVATMASAALIGVGIGVLSMDIRAPEFSVAGLFVVAGLLYMWMILRAWKVMQFLERSFCRRENEVDRRIGVERRSGDDHGYSGPEHRVHDERRVTQRRAVVSAKKAVDKPEPEFHGTTTLNTGRSHD